MDIGKIIFDEFNEWVYNDENQAGVKMEVIDASDLPEIITELVKKLTIPVVSNWVTVKNDLPDNDSQVFVKYENGKYGINEWWENDNCWKYNFDNMIVKEWCKTPCC